MTEATSGDAADHVRAKYDTAIFGLLTTVWGEHLHMALFEDPSEPFGVATERATATMARGLRLRPGQRLLEVACGIGGTARYLARTFGVAVEATNVSAMQIDQGRRLSEAAGLGHLNRFSYADYHDLPFDEASFDAWWCQEAMLYSPDKRRVLDEALRVVRPGGQLVLSDLLFTAAMPMAEREPFMRRQGARHFWTIEQYDALLATMKLRVLERHDWSRHVAPTFDSVTDRFTARRAEFAAEVGFAEVDEVIGRLAMQRDAARAGRLGWAFYRIAA
ncbi:MAG: methyltransferase domain-containing protein [Alphaproteobacteria bacterium]